MRPIFSLSTTYMELLIYNTRKIACKEPELRLKAKKRYVPKTDVLMLATAEQIYNDGIPIERIGVKRLKNSNVVEGVLIDKPRVKNYDQFGQRGNEREGFMYTQKLVKTTPKEQLITYSVAATVSCLERVNEVFSLIMRTFGHTTDSTMQHIHNERKTKKCATFVINSYVQFEHNGVKHTLYIYALEVKQAWVNDRGLQYNFSNANVAEYLALINTLR